MSGKLKAVLLLVVAFGLGIVSGIAWQTYRFPQGESRHAMFAERRVQRLKTKLKLSDAQEQALRQIFQKAHERATQVNEDVSWNLADIHRDSVQAIRQILTPDQVKEFEKLHQKYHARHHRFPQDADSRPRPKERS